ncbi:MAG TPA: DUF4238 domain-containing protein, partial [Clostridia bacterium]|nr:DUF4238 domain-containing protein [Clostridia bacterium]
MEQFTRDNHYLPQLYLKSWSIDTNKIWQYRLLVSNENVPIWKYASIKDVGYHSDLYSGILNGKETDEIEKFFQREIEDPVKPAIFKVENHERLSRFDLEKLVRFLAAQYVRTPARYFRHKPIYDQLIPSLLQTDLRKLVARAEFALQNNLPISTNAKGSKWLPYRTELVQSHEPGKKLLYFEVLCDRQIWFLEMEKILKDTYKCLLDHRWSFVEAATGVTFYTSDDPVLSVRNDGNGEMMGDGAWTRAGTNIIFPLSPRFLMYTEVGSEEDDSIMQKQPNFSYLFQRYTINHAFRSIFSIKQSPYIHECRKRTVNAELFEKEKSEMRSWHLKQTEA